MTATAAAGCRPTSSRRSAIISVRTPTNALMPKAPSICNGTVTNKQTVMNALQKIPPVAISIYGAAGDLTWRKLVPALYNLYLDSRLPEDFLIIGLDIKKMSRKKFRGHLLEGVNEFSRRGKADNDRWKEFEDHIEYQQGDFTKEDSCKKIAQTIEEFDEETEKKVHRLFYLSVPTRF